MATNRNLILKAEVKVATGNCTHAIATIKDGMPVARRVLPVPRYVCIAGEREEGFFLLHFNEAGQSFADTWHESLTAAKRQAKFEFKIDESDWQQI
jgi:hypothetical protein